MNAVQLSIFSNRIEAVCDEMGATLQRAAFSPNIRDRLDFSCAVFDAGGELCAQAAHIPVHLGSMAFAMQGIVSRIDWLDGDMVVLNDPYTGGTHLPDVSLIAPVFNAGELSGFVVNRAHHADIGSETPGSMPISTALSEEGLVISPAKLVSQGRLNEGVLNGILDALKNSAESHGDFSAQIAANRRGARRLQELITHMGLPAYRSALLALNDYAAELCSRSLAMLPAGRYGFSDVLDDDGMGNRDIEIRVTITIAPQSVDVDFSGTSAQVAGNVNCPLSVTAAAVYYVFRCLLPPQTPACAGAFRPIRIHAQQGSVLNATSPAAVAAGNVETSTRVVDAVLGALAAAVPELIPAASHGSMNNLAMGSAGGDGAIAWDYYETIGGGMGACATGDGVDAVHTHMTNTLNTPVESLEMYFPLRMHRYRVRDGSGGCGRYSGGCGIVRDFELLSPARVTVLSERRRHAPWGLAGGGPGLPGENRLNGERLPGKFSLSLQSGDRLSIATAGGGGYGHNSGEGQGARDE
jgi:N-methylhydantoinase B